GRVRCWSPGARRWAPHDSREHLRFLPRTTDRARCALPIAAIYPNLIQVTDAGGLMAYQPNFDDIYKHAAIYVDRILKGAKPSDLPIQQPTEFTLAVNLKAAKAIGLTMPESFLRRAGQLIQCRIATSAWAL